MEQGMAWPSLRKIAGQSIHHLQHLFDLQIVHLGGDHGRYTRKENFGRDDSVDAAAIVQPEALHKPSDQ